MSVDVEDLEFYSEEENKQKKKRKNTLPNLYKLAEKFRSELESLEYCQDHCVFYIYKNNLWKSYKEEFVEKNFFNLLKLRYSQSYYYFNINSFKSISSSLWNRNDIIILYNKLFEIYQLCCKNHKFIKYLESNGFEPFYFLLLHPKLNFQLLNFNLLTSYIKIYKNIKKYIRNCYDYKKK